jgi:transcription antitermination factor NusG
MARLSRQSKSGIVEKSGESEKTGVPLALDVSTDDCQPKWYVAYTYSYHEKRVAGQLRERSIAHFLPLYKVVHRWQDGRAADLQLPVFPGYIFVQLARAERVRVLEISSVVRLVGTSTGPIAIPDLEIETLRKGLLSAVHAEPYSYLTVGSRVRIRRGPFSGAEGFLIRRKQKCQVVISLEIIMRSVAVEVHASDVEPCLGYFPCVVPVPKGGASLEH